ncbi:inositol monophosphatase family protein [Bacteroidota bacterium]
MNLELISMQVSNLSRDIGNFILSEKHKISEENIRTKGLHNLVTYVDTTAEKRLVDGLLRIIPTAGFIVEEGTIEKKDEIFNWIIDPLDGTTNYIHGIPVYSISIALMERKEIVLGVVYEINSRECFYAWKNGGAFLNKNPISVSDNDTMENALLATGFPYYDYKWLDAYVEAFKYFMKNSRGIRRLGSAAVDLAYVACGRFDGFYEYGLNAWDVAAGAFIIQQAGGKVTDFKGGDDFVFGKEIIAGNTNLFEPFREVITRNFK